MWELINRRTLRLNATRPFKPRTHDTRHTTRQQLVRDRWGSYRVPKYPYDPATQPKETFNSRQLFQSSVSARTFWHQYGSECKSSAPSTQSLLPGSCKYVHPKSTGNIVWVPLWEGTHISSVSKLFLL